MLVNGSPLVPVSDLLSNRNSLHCVKVWFVRRSWACKGLPDIYVSRMEYRRRWPLIDFYTWPRDVWPVLKQRVILCLQDQNKERNTDAILPLKD